MENELENAGIENNFTEANKPGAKGFLSLLIPSGDFFITTIIIEINVVIFILMAISGGGIMAPPNEVLLNWGANFRPVTLSGEWWRLFTCTFVHIGILHLFMNMYALVYIGVLLEPLLGRTKFAVAYLLTGLAASTASIWWNDNILSAGASGAIFGMYGVFLALLTTNLIEKNARKPLLTSIGVFIIFNLMNGIKAGIDNAAHIGGLVSGLLTGYIFISSLKNKNKKRLHNISLAISSVCILAVVSYAYTHISNPLGDYDISIETFTKNEETALRFYHLNENTNKEERLQFLKDSGIAGWQKNIALINEMDKNDLPVNLKRQDSLLKLYSELRLKSYELHYKVLGEGATNYISAIDSIDMQIAKVLKVLNAYTSK